MLRDGEQMMCAQTYRASVHTSAFGGRCNWALRGGDGGVSEVWAGLAVQVGVFAGGYSAALLLESLRSRLSGDP